MKHCFWCGLLIKDSPKLVYSPSISIASFFLIYMSSSFAISLYLPKWAFEPSFSTKCSWLISVFNLGTEQMTYWNLSYSFLGVPMQSNNWLHCSLPLKELVVALNDPKDSVIPLGADEPTFILWLRRQIIAYDHKMYRLENQLSSTRNSLESFPQIHKRNF